MARPKAVFLGLHSFCTVSTWSTPHVGILVSPPSRHAYQMIKCSTAGWIRKIMDLEGESKIGECHAIVYVSSWICSVNTRSECFLILSYLLFTEWTRSCRLLEHIHCAKSKSKTNKDTFWPRIYTTNRETYKLPDFRFSSLGNYFPNSTSGWAFACLVGVSVIWDMTGYVAEPTLASISS